MITILSPSYNIHVQSRRKAIIGMTLLAINFVCLPNAIVHFIYRNHEVLSSEQKHVTRFIALANVDNPDKKKRVRKCTVHITYYIHGTTCMIFRVGLGKGSKVELSFVCFTFKTKFLPLKLSLHAHFNV